MCAREPIWNRFFAPCPYVQPAHMKHAVSAEAPPGAKETAEQDTRGPQASERPRQATHSPRCAVEGKTGESITASMTDNLNPAQGQAWPHLSANGGTGCFRGSHLTRKMAFFQKVLPKRQEETQEPSVSETHFQVRHRTTCCACQGAGQPVSWSRRAGAGQGAPQVAVWPSLNTRCLAGLASFHLRSQQPACAWS